MKEIILFKVESPIFRQALHADYVVADFVAEEPRPDHHNSHCRVLVTAGFHGLSREEMALLPKLEMICCVGTGYEKVDLEAAAQRGIRVTHGAGVNADAVADHAMGLLLAVTRAIPAFDRVIRAGGWRADIGSRPTPSSMTLGIVGLGAVGIMIAQRAQAFGMEVLYHSRTRKNDAPWQYVDTVAELARLVDCLVIAAPGGASTHHMVNAEILRALGPEGFLVNVGRGSLVDTEALVHALKHQLIAGAALDVFEEEPHVPAALRELPNVVLTPHIAAISPAVQHKGAALLKKNIDAFMGGSELATPIPGYHLS